MVRAVATAAEIAAQRDTEARGAQAAAKGQAREAQARAATIEQQLAQEQRRFYLQLGPRDGIVVGRNPAQAGVVLDHPEASREHFRLASTGRGPGRAVKPTRREISIFSVSAIDLFVARASGGRFVRADENASLSVTILRAIFDS